MFLQFSGLSLLVHLLIIGAAFVVNRIVGEKTASAFQTYNPEHYIAPHPSVNRVLSLATIIFITSYMFILFTIAIKTALHVGAREPQVLFVKELTHYIEANAVSEVVNPVFFMTLLIGLGLFGAVYLYYKRLVIQSFMTNLQIQDGASAVRHRLTSGLRELSTRLNTLFSFVFGMVIGAVAFSLLLSSPVEAQIVEPGFESEVVAGGFSLATAAVFTPDGRIFVAEKSGVVKVVKNGAVLAEPLVTLTDVNTFGDRGLLGIAIDPNFATNGYIYLSYTYENSPGVNIAGSKTGRIVRLTVAGDTASESSKLVLVGTVGGSVLAPSCENFLVTADCIPSDSNSHSVGGLRFGPDGKLYATLGDGADFSAVDPRALRSQNLDSLGGKMLRINTDGTAPADNPFYTGNPNANRSKVYAYGFRNMFRFNFNPVTGKIYGGDVGWSNWEEVNEIVAGKNYGWPCREGNSTTTYGCTPSETSTNPLYTYPHNSFGAGSITGGAFFSNGAYPSTYATSLFIGDYAQMWMKRLVLDAAGAVVSVENFITDSVWPVEILTGRDGNVYYLDIVSGDLVRITHTSGNRRPVVQLSATPTSGLTPLTVNFSTASTTDPDGDALTYTYAFGDGSVSALANPSHVYATSGSYVASVTVTDSKGAAVTKSLTITAGNQAPQATITSPAAGSFYRALENVTVTGTATDPETGNLPDSAFSWTVLLHHNIHVHTVQQFTNTKTITFVADDHLDPDVYMEIIMTVTDAAGLSTSKSINMYLNNGTAGGNLIANPSLEIADSLQTAPENWIIGWFGQLDPVFTYPVQGLSGNRAAQVQVLSYTSGNAKWYFTPAFVTVGKTYKFSNLYKANATTYVTAQFGRADGTYFYQQLATLPAVADPTTTNISFVVPTGAETVTIFHEIAAVGTLVVDEYSLTEAGATDTIAPTGTITSPANNSVVSGSATVAVDAADNVGVAAVHLTVNGQEVAGAEDTVAPYNLAWDTTAVTNGSYTLTAHIHDTSGNSAQTNTVTVQVFNATSTPTNLIFNGDFEQVDGSGNPLGWTRGGWGTHTRVHTYPVAGVASSSAAQVAITKYDFGDTGDAKWSHTDVPVTPGVQYRYESYYKASSISDVIGRYTFADGSYHYFGLIKELPGVANWTPIANTFVPPQNAVSVTFFHLISSVATLAIDNVALYAVSTGTPAEINPPVVSFISPLASSTIRGTVTLQASATDDTAVVGVYFAINGAPYGAEDTVAPYEITLDTTTLPNGVYVLKATSHDPYGNNDKAEITVTVDNTTPPPTTNNLILNPSLDIVGATGDPANWKRGGWGTNDRTFTYPVAGQSGNAARVAITNYTNGDAKWYFDEVTVAPGDQYTFTEAYKANATTNLTLRYQRPDGTFLYIGVGNPLASGVWQTNQVNFTVPAGVTKLTVMHILNLVGVLEVDNQSLVKTNGTSTDTTGPVASITTPAASSTVSGTVNVTVSASDVGTGLASVQILIDNTAVATFGATGPFTYVWDTLTATSGSHTLSARAVDVAGNVTVVPVRSVTVNNVIAPPPPTTNNLILNPSLDIVGATGDPANWKRGGWGTNDRTFTYPVAGQSGNAARVAITNYTNGDAKWYFDDIVVTPGQQYTFSYNYKASAPSNITLRYTRTDGTYLYVGMGNPNAVANWTTGGFTVIPPAGVVSLTVMHILNQVGVLEIDNQSLSTGNTNTLARGKVSFSFDDGWIEHATVAAPILNAAGLDGTFYIISSEMLGADPTERLLNPSLDIVGATGDPANWKRGGWGTNDRTFTYPVAGQSGNAARVAITNYTNGDAKWYFDDVTVMPNFKYRATGRYQSTATTEILVRYTLTDGSFLYQFLKNLPATGLGNWGTYSEEFTTPTNAVSLTVFHVLAQVGELVTDNLSVMQVQIYADTAQVLALQAAGHEIGAHTRTHTSLTTLSTSGKTTEIAGSKSALEGAGLTIRTIAYPYGTYDDEVKSITSASGYTLGRSVDRGFNDKASDPYALRIQQVGRDTTLAQLESWIDQAAQNNTWLIFMFHQISNNPDQPLGINESDFTALVNYAAGADVDVITVAEGATLLTN